VFSHGESLQFKVMHARKAKKNTVRESGGRKHYTWERSSLVNRSQQKYGGTADKLCVSKLRDEIKIAIFIESITFTGNGIVNHETFTCNSDLLVLYNQAIFFL
jgi:hypothetical protein